MGYQKSKRPILAPKGVKLAGSGGRLTHPTESITGSSVAQTLSAVGASFITYASSGKTNDVIIPNPPAAGVVKYIFAINNTTSIELNLNTASTANVFWGTTFNTATLAAASTGSPGGAPSGPPAITLIGVSTSQWAANFSSTFHWDLSATTGSTATA